MNTYHRLPVVFTRGEGVRLFDASGKSYLDFSSGIAVNCLGHNNPALVDAIKKQAEKLIHVCNYYQSDVSEAFAEKLIAVSGLKKLFLCNSGAEANEGAIKIARKYSFKKYGKNRHRIVTLTGSFHGRTISTLSATGQDKFHENFGPFTEGFVYIPPNDAAALEKALNDISVCAFFFEPIQGESGVIPLSADYLKKAAEICAQKDILLIADEIQCGLGRTGEFFACNRFNLTPDIATLAKGLCGGVPAGAVLAGEKTADVLEYDHGSTFGGNALAAAAGLVVLETITANGFMDEIKEKGAFFADKLDDLELDGFDISRIRGAGLMLGADVSHEDHGLLEKALEKGLLFLGGGPKTLRFLPPYTITREEIIEGISILSEILPKTA